MTVTSSFRKYEIAFEVLRHALAILFLWLGLAKIFDTNISTGIVAKVYPVISNDIYLYIILGIIEICIGLGFLIPRFTTISGWVTIAHLLIGSVGIFFSGQVFSGHFPVLSIYGQVALGNIALIAACILLIDHEEFLLEVSKSIG